MMVRAIERALSERCDVEIFRLRSFLETRSVLDFVEAFAQGFMGLLGGKPLALQCLLYATADRERLAAKIANGGFQAVYLDTVRCQLLLRTLRRRLPDIRIVTDFDDLLSRRMTKLIEYDQPFTAGIAGAFIPRFARRLIEGHLHRLVTRHEAATLRYAEEEAVAASNAIVLVSSTERRELLRSLNERHRTIVHALPPPADIRAVTCEAPASHRFIFIGSDRLLQNRLAIDYLVALWRRLKPAATAPIREAVQRP